MEDPAAIQCNLAGNPLHDEQLAIVRMLGDVYAVNTVIDEVRVISSQANFGEVIDSHLAAVGVQSRKARRSPVGRRFAIVLSSGAAGHPLQQTYYQTVKGMEIPARHPGGAPAAR